MGVARIVSAAGLGLGLAAAVAAPSTQAADSNLATYQGAWLVQGTDCADIYSSTGKVTSFKKPVDLFTPAFIISGNRLRTPQASCRIRSVKPNGDRQVLVLDCANAVAGHEVKVQMATQPGGTLRRYFNERDTTGTPYQQCSR